MRQLNEIHLARPFLGSRRLVDELTDRGLTVNRKRVQRLLRFMGITATYLSPAENVLCGLGPEQPNQVWSADITYLWLRGSRI